MSEIELRNIKIGNEQLQVAVQKREDGKATPRALVAGVTAPDVIDLVGQHNFTYGAEVKIGRVDTSDSVAEAIIGGAAELGIVSEIPQPLHENIGVLLTIPKNGSEISILGQISNTVESAK